MATSISALQRNASAVVRRVAASGEAEEITDRGRVVAVLSPPPGLSGLERLIHAGVAHPATPAAISEALASAESLPPLDIAGALVEQRDLER